MNPPAIGTALLLLLAANGAPVIARRLGGDRWDTPLDFGGVWRDGRPWLGPAKTWRGLLAGVGAGAVVAPLLGLAPALGALFALFTLLGDAAASFVKRRLGIPASDSVLGLDQLPEALLPCAVLAPALGLAWLDVLGAAAAFFVVEIVLSRLLYRLRIRERPL